MFNLVLQLSVFFSMRTCVACQDLREDRCRISDKGGKTKTILYTIMKVELAVSGNGRRRAELLRTAVIDALVSPTCLNPKEKETDWQFP